MWVLIFYIFASEAFADLNTWNVTKGRKHDFYEFTVSLKELKKKIFSPEQPFDQKWKWIHKVAKLSKKKEALIFLRQCLKRPEWYLQSAALQNFKDLEPKEALLHAKSLLKKSNSLVVRSAAVKVLYEKGSRSDLDVLWSALYNRKNFRKAQSLWIRPQIAKAIQKLENGFVSKKWKELLTDPDKTIQELAKRRQTLAKRQ